jgi:hypothetical protein
MVVSCHQNVGQNHNLLIANKAFENVAKREHLQIKTVFTKKLRNKLRLQNACHHSA